MWIDEPQRPSRHRVATVADQSLEMLNRHPRPLDAQQFIDAGIAVAASPDNRRVERVWQQVDEGKFRGKTPTNLLMTAERHLPSRKTEENQSVLLQKRSNMLEKLAFVRFFDVLNDIVDEDEVETLVLGRRLLGKDEILADESAALLRIGEKFPCLLDSRLAEVDARHLAADFGKGQQVSALATADFQHASLLREADFRAQIVEVEIPRRVGQFREILLSVLMSFLHKTPVFVNIRVQSYEIFLRLAK